jgi:hypothetical protein
MSFSFTAQRCIRASPEVDQTNGFFVALFTRKEDVLSTCNTKLDQVNTSTDGDSFHNTQQDFTSVKTDSLKRKSKMKKTLKEKAKKRKLDNHLEKSYTQNAQEDNLNLTKNNKFMTSLNEKKDVELKDLQRKTKKKKKKKKKVKSVVNNI